MSCLRRHPRGGRPPKIAPVGQPTITQAFGLMAQPPSKCQNVRDEGEHVAVQNHAIQDDIPVPGGEVSSGISPPTQPVSPNLFEDAMDVPTSTGAMEMGEWVISPDTKYAEGIAASGSDTAVSHLIGDVVKGVLTSVCAGKLKASQYMKRWMRDLDVQATTADIVEALRPRAKQLLRTMMRHEKITSSNLLQIRGNIHDESQGVYLDIVTTESSEYGLYTGAAAATVSPTRSFRGLSRRIRKHLSKANRQSRPCLHYDWIDRPGNKPNFVVLVVWSSTVPKQLVYFTEAVMTIIFESYDDEGFHRIRPRQLSTTGGTPLNRDTPLRTELHADDNKEVAAKRAQGRRDGAAKTALIKQERALQTCLKGGVVKLSAEGKRLRFRVLALPYIDIPRPIIDDWGLDGESEVKVVYDIEERGVHRHKFAKESNKEDDGSVLGIKLVYGDRHVWLSRKGKVGVRMANSLVDFLRGVSTGVEGIRDDRYPLHTRR